MLTAGISRAACPMFLVIWACSVKNRDNWVYHWCIFSPRPSTHNLHKNQNSSASLGEAEENRRHAGSCEDGIWRVFKLGPRGAAVPPPQALVLVDGAGRVLWMTAAGLTSRAYLQESPGNLKQLREKIFLILFPV